MTTIQRERVRRDLTLMRAMCDSTLHTAEVYAAPIVEKKPTADDHVREEKAPASNDSETKAA